jgi:hypothetical protein
MISLLLWSSMSWGEFFSFFFPVASWERIVSSWNYVVEITTRRFAATFQ